MSCATNCDFSRRENSWFTSASGTQLLQLFVNQMRIRCTFHGELPIA
jgi:hypothetical protein